MMKRRGMLVGASAALAMAAGAGVAIRRAERGPDGDAEALWALNLEQPAGGELRPGALRGRPLLANFWATWCPPCVAELPLLDGFARSHPGWQVIGLAVDQLPPVRAFLARHAVSYRVGMAGLDGIDVARRLGNASGGLPFSVVLSSRGRVAARKLGAIGADDLTAWAKSVA